MADVRQISLWLVIVMIMMGTSDVQSNEISIENSVSYNISFFSLFFLMLRICCKVLPNVSQLFSPPSLNRHSTPIFNK